jgi:hypothetical protein
MLREADEDLSARHLYLAGERVLPGTYRQIGSGREIRLDTEDFLPASLDGHVACYRRMEHTWRQLAPRAQSGG